MNKPLDTVSTATSLQPLKIVGLEVENVKRVRVVEVHPDGSLVIVGGRNGQGKTSLLDAIEMALAGGRSIPPDPVRHGSRKARVSVDLGDLVVTRSFSPKGTKLVVTTREGAPVKSPQKVLDELCAAVSFDPLEFARAKPARQDEIIKQVLGLDFTRLDEERAQLYEARKDANKRAKSLDAQLDALPEIEGSVPDEEVSAAELLAELDRRRAVLEDNDRQHHDLNLLKSSARTLDTQAEDLQAEIVDLEQLLTSKREELEELGARRSDLAKELIEKTAEVEALVDPDVGAVREQLAQLDATNRKVREAQKKRDLEADLELAQQRAEKCTEAIEAIDEKKVLALEQADFPVPGLGFGDLGPTLDGVPLEQASGAQKLRLSVAIGAALNPRLKVMLVRDPPRLDSDSLKLLGELAAETGSQVWLERVSETGEGCSVVIEDGRVAT